MVPRPARHDSLTGMGGRVMTAGDGAAEPLRVPPWLAGGVPVPDPAPRKPADPAADLPDDAPAASAPPADLPAAFAPPADLPAASAPPADLPAASEPPEDLPADDPAAEPPESADVEPHGPDLPAAGGWRRLAGPGWRRLAIAWLAAVLVLVLAMIFGVVALRDDNRVDRRGEPAAGVPSPGPSPSVSPPDAGSGATPSASATGSASPSPRTTTPAPSRSPQPTRFGPVTFEAEASGNTIGGSAWVASYPGASGGAIVRNIGDWDTRQGDGFLRFENVTVPVAGTYTLKLFHVNIDNERTRTAVITVSGGDPQSVTTAGGSTCCAATSVRVELRKGRNTVTIANKDGHAPSVDRIVLSLP
jgi:hypothetical protein